MLKAYLPHNEKKRGGEDKQGMDGIRNIVWIHDKCASPRGFNRIEKKKACSLNEYI